MELRDTLSSDTVSLKTNKFISTSSSLCQSRGARPAAPAHPHRVTDQAHPPAGAKTQPSKMNEDKESSKEQKFSHSKKQKDKGNPTHKKREFSWHIASIILGIISFFLLLATRIFVYMLLQSSFACKIQDLEDTKGRNATALEIEALSTLQPCTSVVQDKQIPSDTCHGNWSCCGSNCYYFSKEEKSWDESKESCEAIGSLLSKIDDEDEQRYIEQRIQYNYWVGLRTKGIAHPWLWLDGARLSHRLSAFLYKVRTTQSVIGANAYKISYKSTKSRKLDHSGKGMRRKV
ncbi:natural killer cells antigen CD94-like isoform X2 [Talpa occidentalis]|uniref:natural killer cells antigen CD94-like isoform X2 n=1 Tax=Talpa occidentalis TaxID=50954 RepID=UPI0023F921CB|nr:natural killer cells antigen CD94-like isoform X2 [Talpa occidentalis]